MWILLYTVPTEIHIVAISCTIPLFPLMHYERVVLESPVATFKPCAGKRPLWRLGLHAPFLQSQVNLAYKKSNEKPAFHKTQAFVEPITQYHDTT